MVARGSRGLRWRLCRRILWGALAGQLDALGSDNHRGREATYRSPTYSVFAIGLAVVLLSRQQDRARRRPESRPHGGRSRYFRTL